MIQDFSIIEEDDAQKYIRDLHTFKGSFLNIT